MYYVYLHKRKGTNKVFYVGKGTKSKNGERSESTKNRNQWWHNIVNKDGGFDIEIYKDNLTEDEAFQLEIKVIAEIGKENLLNMTDGGFGGDTLSNHPNIDDIGKRISEHHKGNGNPNYGKGYYYWWVQKYGKAEADTMLAERGRVQSEKTKGVPKKPRPDVLGDNNPAKRDEVREKIRQKKLNQPKVTCPKCGHVVSESRLPLHIDKPPCIKKQKIN
jgi:hypothetical protein